MPKYYLEYIVDKKAHSEQLRQRELEVLQMKKLVRVCLGCSMMSRHIICHPVNGVTLRQIDDVLYTVAG